MKPGIKPGTRNTRRRTMEMESRRASPTTMVTKARRNGRGMKRRKERKYGRRKTFTRPSSQPHGMLVTGQRTAWAAGPGRGSHSSLLLCVPRAQEWRARPRRPHLLTPHMSRLLPRQCRRRSLPVAQVRPVPPRPSPRQTPTGTCARSSSSSSWPSSSASARTSGGRGALQDRRTGKEGPAFTRKDRVPARPVHGLV
jgi:hypothetical protein